jgi:uncharacterized protein (DUF1330 family)
MNIDSDVSQPFTLAFVGYTTPELADRAAAYEDAVLPLVVEHGGHMVYRGRRRGGQDGALPFEIHLLWFPHQTAFHAYVDDPRRAELVTTFGEVFTSKHVVELETISGMLTA